MLRKLATSAALGLLIAFPASSRAGDEKVPWIHVEVLEDQGDGARVKVNLPLSLAKVALSMASEMESEHFDRGHIRIENADITVQDLRALWRELKDAGDAEFVEAEDDGETVKLFRKGSTVFVHVDSDDGDEKVRIEVPIAVVDALLSGEGETLDLAAAVDQLQGMTPGDIISIRDGEDTVRVWID